MVRFLAGLLALSVGCSTADERWLEAESEAEPTIVAEVESENELEADELCPLLEGQPPGFVTGLLQGNDVPYSCAGVSTPAAEPLHAAVAALLTHVPLSTPDAPTATDGLRAAFEAAERAELAQLSLRDRVVLQALAVKLWRHRTPLARRARALAQRVALAPGQLRELGSDAHAELAPVLGETEGWVDRKGPSCGPIGIHDSAFGGQLSFRTLRAGQRRALAGQIVAFDTRGEPHVTPFLALVEMRNGMQADSPACVIEIGGEGLTRTPHSELVPSAFIRPAAAGTVGCGGCHTGRGSFDLSDVRGEDALSFRVERRVAVLELARQTAVGLLRDR